MFWQSTADVVCYIPAPGVGGTTNLFDLNYPLLLLMGAMQCHLCCPTMETSGPQRGFWQKCYKAASMLRSPFVFLDSEVWLRCGFRVFFSACTVWLALLLLLLACVFAEKSGVSQNKQGEINTCSGQITAGECQRGNRADPSLAVAIHHTQGWTAEQAPCFYPSPDKLLPRSWKVKDKLKVAKGFGILCWRFSV